MAGKKIGMMKDFGATCARLHKIRIYVRKEEMTANCKSECRFRGYPPTAIQGTSYPYAPELRKTTHITNCSSAYAMALIGAIAVKHFKGKYRWIYQPICHVRSGFAATILELFFSRLCQSYSWLGGTNTEIAGKSADKAWSMTDKDKLLILSSIDVETIEKNAEKAREKLSASLQGLEDKKRCPELEEEIAENEKKLKEARETNDLLEKQITALQGQSIPDQTRLAQELEAFESMIELRERLTPQKALNKALEKLVLAEEEVNEAMGLPQM
ncbi:hypothetical protein EG329_000811 [Mollisiaceae sp. DMI_Dod_QoI]|nr:hypothetical protein EG329_000811 [Helotiales sp. DMI_Dod_QoI]